MNERGKGNERRLKRRGKKNKGGRVKEKFRIRDRTGEQKWVIDGVEQVRLDQTVHNFSQEEHATESWWAFHPAFCVWRHGGAILLDLEHTPWWSGIGSECAWSLRSVWDSLPEPLPPHYQHGGELQCWTIDGAQWLDGVTKAPPFTIPRGIYNWLLCWRGRLWPVYGTSRIFYFFQSWMCNRTLSVGFLCPQPSLSFFILIPCPG